MRRRNRQAERYPEDNAAPASRTPLTYRVAWAAGIALAAVLVLLVFGVQFSALNSYNQRADQLNQSIARAQAANQELQDQRDRAATDAGVEEAARDLGMLKPGERPIVPRPENTGAVGRQPFQPEREREALPNWKRWWRWAFGDPTRSSR